MTTLNHFIWKSGLPGPFLWTAFLRGRERGTSSSELEELDSGFGFGACAPCSEASVWKVVMTTSYFSRTFATRHQQGLEIQILDLRLVRDGP